MEKDHGSRDEILLLVGLKREHAKRALNEIIDRLCGINEAGNPHIAVLDYLTNMIYAVELLLKLLASDWKSHKVGKMYQEAFGLPYANAGLMNKIERALYDQKYLLQPSSGLLEQIPEMERLFVILRDKIQQDQSHFHVTQEIDIPRQLVEYLQDNVPAIYSTPMMPGYLAKQAPTIWRQEVVRRQEALKTILGREGPIRLWRCLGSHI